METRSSNRKHAERHRRYGRGTKRGARLVSLSAAFFRWGSNRTGGTWTLRKRSINLI